MLSSALMAVLIASSPAHPAEPARPVAQIKSACDAQALDPKFVHYMEKTPGEKDAPHLHLIAEHSKATSLVTPGPSNCVLELTRLDLVR